MAYITKIMLALGVITFSYVIYVVMIGEYQLKITGIPAETSIILLALVLTSVLVIYYTLPKIGSEMTKDRFGVELKGMQTR
jgi:hypothetical protein